MNMLGFKRIIILAPLLLCMSIASALADDNEETAGSSPPSTSPWTVDLGLYAFFPTSVKGTSTVNGGTVELDVGLKDVFDLLEFALAGRVEAWRDRPDNDGSAFGFVLDGYYFDLGIDADGLGPASGTSLDVDIRQGVIDLMAGYRLPQVNLSNSGQALIFEVMAGARFNFLRQKIKITPGLPFPFVIDLGGDKEWVEPVIGTRATWVLNDRWNLNVRGDLAGFGVAGDELTWSLTGVAAWRAWEKTTIQLGYRVYDIDYSDGSGFDEFGLNLRVHGPFLAINFRL